jgi:salicylate hydroxylase
VGADGQRSIVREALSPGHALRPSGVAEMISAVSAPDVVAELAGTILRFRDPAGGLGVGVIPTSAETLVWYVTFDTSRWPASDSWSGRLALASTVARWAWPLPVLAERTDFRRAHVWYTADSDPLPALYRDDVVLVGDAAHPLLPFSTQGANSALVDAVSLADALRTGIGHDLALDRWSAQRLLNVAAYREHGRARARTFLDPLRSPPDPTFPDEALQRDIATLASEAISHAL